MPRPVFLDVDNTLLDNDAAKSALESRIADAVAPEIARRFWELYERVRDAKDYVDFPATVERLGLEHAAAAARIREVLDALPYRVFVYPGVMGMIERLWRAWTPVILSDGDPVFQRRKIERAGLAAAVHGNVLIYVHKDDRLADVTARFEGSPPVFVDDKARILGHIEREMAEAITVHVAQGSHADEPLAAGDPRPDIEIARIVELPEAIEGR